MIKMKNVVHICVVSHKHAKLILELNCLADLSKMENVRVYIKCNSKDEHAKELSLYCNNNNIFMYDDNYGMGFGENNNYIFNKILTDEKYNDDDFFLCLNPDVFIKPNVLSSLVILCRRNNIKMSTINLYKNFEKSIVDGNVRVYPSFYSFTKSLLGFGNDCIIDKSSLSDEAYVDWAAGSFLLFDFSTYSKLSGFDERYFMYCEDVDICYRANKQLGIKVKYFNTLEAIHIAQHDNRRLFSKAMFNHIHSAFKFLMSK